MRLLFNKVHLRLYSFGYKFIKKNPVNDYFSAEFLDKISNNGKAFVFVAAIAFLQPNKAQKLNSNTTS